MPAINMSQLDNNKKKLEIFNLTFAQLGLNLIGNINDDSEETRIIEACYSNVKKTCLSLYPWHFAKTIVQIKPLDKNDERLIHLPDKLYIPDKLFLFEAPEDSLRILSLSDDFEHKNKVDYKIVNQLILTDVNPAFLIYIADISEQYLPSYFLEVLSNKLALEVSLALMDSVSKINNLFRRLQTSIHEAKKIDISIEPTQYKFINSLKYLRE